MNNRIYRPQGYAKSYGNDNSKPDVVVPVIGIVVVAVGTAGVPIIVVPVTAAQHASCRSPTPKKQPELFIFL